MNARAVPVPADIALAVVVGGAELVSLAVVARDGDPDPVAAYVVLAAAAVLLAFRRVQPVGVWAGITGLTLAYGIADWADPPMQVAALIALYTVAAVEPRNVAIATGIVTLGLAALAWVFDPEPNDLNDVLTPMLAATTAWLAGLTAGAQRRTIAVLEHDREEHAARLLAEERLRIARELHDVTAHHVTVMAIQAEAGAAAPATAEHALAAIAASARDALADLRRMLGVLRDRAGDESLRPQPSLADLPELVDHVRGGAFTVDLDVNGPIGPTDGVELAAYRIVQEALTNVARHATARHVQVHVTSTAATITLEVADDGAPGPIVEGHGLRGMRERAALYDGEVEFDATPSGFRVRAKLHR